MALCRYFGFNSKAAGQYLRAKSCAPLADGLESHCHRKRRVVREMVCCSLVSAHREQLEVEKSERTQLTHALALERKTIDDLREEADAARGVLSNLV